MAMSAAKGSRRERELTRDLHDAGWAVIRVPTSGAGTSRALPDVFAMRCHPTEPRSIAIAAEVKANADEYTPLSSEEVHALEAFASRAGPACLPVIVTHPNYGSWNAWTTYELNERDAGYSVVQDMYPGRGLEDLAGMAVIERVWSESESDGGHGDE